MTRSGPSELWFERLYAFLHLPFWVGAPVFGGLVFLAAEFAALSATGLSEEYVPFVGLLFTSALILILCQFAARRARQGIEQLHEYAGTLGAPGKPDLRPLYGVRSSLIAYLVLISAIAPIYILSAQPLQTIPVALRILASMPIILGISFVTTFIWVWSYCLYSIFRIGRLELNLKPFTEDRTLGLRPLGRFSLQLIGMYVGILAVIVLPQLAAALSALPLLAFLVALSLLPLVFFFLPLLPLRTKLIRAKRELLRRIGVRYTRAFEQIDSSADGPVSPSVVNELAVIDMIRRDIQQIYTWPFDIGIVIRLSAIVLSVTAIILATVIIRAIGI